MSPKRVFYVLVGVISLIGVLSVAGAVAGSNLLTQKSSKLNGLKLENEVLDRQRQDVIAAKANIEKYEELERIAKQIVPQDKDQARTVREIVKFARESTNLIQSVSFPTSTLGQKAVPPTTPSSSTPMPTTQTAPITQVQPVPGLNGVYELEIIIKNEPGSADFSKLVTFLKKLEANRRTSQVNKMQIIPSEKNRNLLTFTITFKIYLKP